MVCPAGDTLQAVASGEGVGSLSPPFVQLFKPVVQEPEEGPPWHRNTLVLPLRVGQVWPCESGVAELVGATTTDTKTVEVLDTVAVPAGAFPAFRVAYSVQAPEFSLRVEQWFATVGLVQMSEMLVATGYRTDERGELLGQVEQTETATMALKGFRLVGTASLVRGSSWGAVKQGSQ